MKKKKWKFQNKKYNTLSIKNSVNELNSRMKETEEEPEHWKVKQQISPNLINREKTD